MRIRANDTDPTGSGSGPMIGIRPDLDPKHWLFGYIGFCYLRIMIFNIMVSKNDITMQCILIFTIKEKFYERKKSVQMIMQNNCETCLLSVLISFGSKNTS